MTDPNSVPAYGPAQPPVPLQPPAPLQPPVPAQPPAPLQPPGALVPPPQELYAPETAAPSSWAALLDPAPALARTFAAAIDFLLTFVVTIAVAACLLVAGFSRGVSGYGTGSTLLYLSFASLVVIPVLANVLKARRIRTRQQTLGKQAMRITIVDARSGRAVTMGQALIRSALLAIPGLVTVGAINLLWAIWVGSVGSTGPSFSGLSPLGLVAPIVWTALLVWMSVGDRRGPWDSAARTRVVTAQSVWWAANNVPNPRLAADPTNPPASAAR
jgi:uncharacterized RDD family membrane protein YckC